MAAIKIDVEGAELAAVAGLERILSRPDAPLVYYESNTHTHQHAGTSVGQVVAALEGHGYRSYAVSAGRLTRVRPDDPQREVVRDHLAVKGPLPPLRSPHHRRRTGLTATAAPANRGRGAQQWASCHLHRIARTSGSRAS